ncbi:hypothetical protein AB0F17_63245 [Nonomuraea sp. NPDC026600]|uniref:hypothetical protein n=1 Tax=Nonomuraea sp. NPDC026600 TaxID=3155363 RepID=UPI0033C787C4
MEPVEVVLGLGVEVAGQGADVLAAVGEEDDLLVVGQALGAQDFVQASFGFVIVGLDEGEAFGGAAAGGGALAGDGLEPAVAAGGLVAGVDVAAVQGDDQGKVRAGR